MSPRTIIYFNSGAIGEFLMTLYFSEIVERKDLHIIVPVRRNAALLQELGREYPAVQVLSLGKGFFWESIKILFATPNPRVVITQQTFGRHPIGLILLAYCVSLFGRKGSIFMPFADQWLSKFLGTDTWTFDYSSTFPVEMCRLAKRIGGEKNCSVPRLRGFDRRERSVSHIVFHTRAQTPSRTPPIGKWRELVQEARNRWPTTEFLFSGSNADNPYIESIVAGIQNCRIIAGVSTRELLDTLQTAIVYVGPDTGITHLAAFIGTPEVVWGTRSTPCWWTTYSPSAKWLTEARRCACIGIKSEACRVESEGELRFRCMLDVKIEDLIEAMHVKILNHA